MLPRPRSIRVALATLAVCIPSITFAADWPQWLGPNRNGVWAETDIIESFPKDGLKPLWRVPVDGGYSGPAVVGDRVYITDRVASKPADDAPKGQLPGTERILCMSSKDGSLIWKHEYNRVYSRVDRPMGPRTTPVITSDHLYTLGSMGDLICLDLKTGKPVWQKYFPDDFKTKAPVWGYSASLLLHNGLVIALVGGDDHAVVAFDAKTGEKKWNCLTTKDVGYSPPVIAKVGDTEHLIVWLSDALAGLNPKTGEVHWQHAHPEKGVKQMTPAVSIITPKVVGDTVYVSSAYDGPLAIKLTSDKAKTDLLWRSKNTYPKPPEKIAILMTTIIAKGDHLYSLSADTGAVLCADAKTGETVWTDNKLFGGKDALFGSAFWVEQGEQVFCFTDSGDLVILKLNPKEYQEVGRTHILDPIGADRGRKVIWAHPAFANKCIYVRNEKELVCYSLAK